MRNAISYCPNCSAELDALAVDQCWNCHAEFGAKSAWEPVAHPPGEFRVFLQPRNEPKQDVLSANTSETHPIAQVLTRLIVGIVIWLIGSVTLLVLWLGPAIPYGGAINPAFPFLELVLTLSLLIWIVLPLFVRNP
ncbi:hypothetical protein GmRootV118_17950 [Variovorax sp. V118]